MDDLTPTESDFADFLSEGGSEDTLFTPTQDTVEVTESSVVVGWITTQGDAETLEVPELLPLEHLRVPLGMMIAKRAKQVQRSSLVTEVKQLVNFAGFLAGRRNAGSPGRLCRIADIDNDLLSQFRAWLDTRKAPATKTAGRTPYAAKQRKGGRPLTTDYKRSLFSVVLAFLRRLRLDERYAGEVRPDLDLHRDQEWKTPGRRKPTIVLTRPQLKLLVRICREQVVDVTARLHAAWRINDGIPAPGDTELVDPAMLKELTEMAAFFANRPEEGQEHRLAPSSREAFWDLRREFRASGIAGFDRHRFPLLWATNAKSYRKLVDLLYPTPAAMMPFVLLFAIYYRYNPSVLGGITQKHFKVQPSAFGERLAGKPFKNRAGRIQHASWPVTGDAHNPAEMVRTLERWTEPLRPYAPDDQRDHMFLSRTQLPTVRSFAQTNALSVALAIFLRKHQQKLGITFEMRSVRASVINLVHHLFDGDMVVTMHAGQHRKESTTNEHYLSDGARKENDERLVPTIHQMNRWVHSEGALDPRRGELAPSLAATPGWMCRNPYLGIVPGETEDLCRAYGRCIGCEMAIPQFNSPVAYALAVKLHDAINRARNSMPEHAWLDRWMPLRDELDRMIELSFTREAKAEADLDIPDLPTVE